MDYGMKYKYMEKERDKKRKTNAFFLMKKESDKLVKMLKD